MANLVGVPLLLVVSLFMGAVIGAQWFPRKNGDPPMKPFKQKTAVVLVSVCGVIFVSVLLWALFAGGGA